jgi:hypothetical protein
MLTALWYRDRPTFGQDASRRENERRVPKRQCGNRRRNRSRHQPTLDRDYLTRHSLVSHLYLPTRAIRPCVC